MDPNRKGPAKNPQGDGKRPRNIWIPLIISAVILLLIGVCVWGVFGQLDTTLSVAAVTENDQTLCYVKEADMKDLETGIQVRIGENQYHIKEIIRQPVQVDDSFADYLLHVGDLSEGQWVYIAVLDDVYGEDGLIVEAKVVIESIAPMRFVLN